MTTNNKQFLEEFLKKLGVQFDSVDVQQSELNQEVYKIQTKTPNTLIGQHGDVLRALTHIVKKILQNKEVDTHFMIDVNEHRSNQIKTIEKTAKLLAERAQSLKYDVEMQPMNPYERMVVHSVLADMENISTESVGAGRDRRVVIKYTAV